MVPSVHRRLQGARIRCSASASGDAAPPEIPALAETNNGSVSTSRPKPQVWVAIGVAVVAIGLAVSAIILRRNYLLGSNQRQLIADLSASASSSQEAAQFTVNWFGRRISLSERSPG